jgi:decaprenylphospho-beta-D-erythro-pentofuranosid-2-ulose 2-reductase
MTESSISIPSPATPLTPRKRAILIGASSGIGAALAQQLASEGWTLALLARRADLLTALCADINQKAGEVRAVSYAHDVSNTGEVPALLQKAIADLGGLDLFVYNTGILIRMERTEFDFEKDFHMTEINYLGALAWLNPVAALFQGQDAGTIVGIGSVAGDRGRVGAPAYNASKAALHTYLEALRNRLTRHGVHVLTVKPGFVNTEMVKSSPRAFLVISVEKAAADISRAIRRRKQQLYTPWFWGWIMFVIRHIPSVLFRRMSF